MSSMKKISLNNEKQYFYVCVWSLKTLQDLLTYQRLRPEAESLMHEIYLRLFDHRSRGRVSISFPGPGERYLMLLGSSCQVLVEVVCATHSANPPLSIHKRSYQPFVCATPWEISGTTYLESVSARVPEWGHKLLGKPAMLITQGCFLNGGNKNTYILSINLK